MDAALEIVEAGGPDALTVRGLASKLSVAVTSIYWHVGDRQAVLQAVGDRVVARFGHVAVRGRTPRARLLSLARRLRILLLEEAELVALVHRQGRAPELLQPARRRITTELVDSGLEVTSVALAAQAILNHVIGSVLLDRQVARQPAQHPTTEELWATEQDLGSPALKAALTCPVDDERLFEYSLSKLVDAVLVT